MYGLVKKFVGLLLEEYASEAERNCWSLTRASKVKLRERGARMKLTADFGRPFKDLTKHWKGYNLDEWLHFLETFSLYLLSLDMMHPLMWTMWNLLR